MPKLLTKHKTSHPSLDLRVCMDILARAKQVLRVKFFLYVHLKVCAQFSAAVLAEHLRKLQGARQQFSINRLKQDMPISVAPFYSSILKELIIEEVDNKIFVMLLCNQSHCSRQLLSQCQISRDNS